MWTRRPVVARAFGDRGEQRVRAPLRAIRAELHRKGRLSTASAIASTRAIWSSTPGMGPRNCASTVARASVGQVRRAMLRLVAVDERIAVAHEDGERHAHADVGGGAGESRAPPRPATSARGSGCSAPSPSRRRRARRGRRRRARRDRGRSPASPRDAGASSRAASPPRRTRSATAAGNGRAHWRAPAWREAAGTGGFGRRRDRGDAAVLDCDVDRRRRPARRRSGARTTPSSPRTHGGGSSMTLTWAATIRQPSGKRIQVCICRPILPGRAVAPEQRRGDRAVAAVGRRSGSSRACARGRPASARRGRP